MGKNHLPTRTTVAVVGRQLLVGKLVRSLGQQLVSRRSSGVSVNSLAQHGEMMMIGMQMMLLKLMEPAAHAVCHVLPMTAANSETSELLNIAIHCPASESMYAKTTTTFQVLHESEHQSVTELTVNLPLT